MGHKPIEQATKSHTTVPESSPHHIKSFRVCMTDKSLFLLVEKCITPQLATAHAEAWAVFDCRHRHKTISVLTMQKNCRAISEVNSSAIPAQIIQPTLETSSMSVRNTCRNANPQSDNQTDDTSAAVRRKYCSFGRNVEGIRPVRTSGCVFLESCTADEQIQVKREVRKCAQSAKWHKIHPSRTLGWIPMWC